jgi:hypothetical protein
MVYWPQTVSLITNGLAFVILGGLCIWMVLAIGVVIMEVYYRIKEKFNA